MARKWQTTESWLEKEEVAAFRATGDTAGNDRVSYLLCLAFVMLAFSVCLSVCLLPHCLRVRLYMPEVRLVDQLSVQSHNIRYSFYTSELPADLNSCSFRALPSPSVCPMSVEPAISCARPPTRALSISHRPVQQSTGLPISSRLSSLATWPRKLML